jgi:hypothetical protein
MRAPRPAGALNICTWIRGCDARIRRESGASRRPAQISRNDVRRVARVGLHMYIMQCCAHLPRKGRATRMLSF